MRPYATQLWAQRRGFVLPPDQTKASAARFDCDRKHCTPKAGAAPAMGAWWSTRTPHPEDMDLVCAASAVVVLRADAAPPASCGGKLVLVRGAFIAGGAVEIYATPRGWRLLWAQSMRGDRPWSRPAQ